MYSAIQSPIERAVEISLGHKIGQGIRTGGGFSGPENNREYVLIFSDNATKSEIQRYIKGMTEGAKIYAQLNRASKANVSQEEYDKIYDKYKKWLQSKGY